MVALITDVHYRMTPAMIRTLTARGVTVYTCERKTHPAPVGAQTRGVCGHFTLPEADYTEALYDSLTQLGQRHHCKPALLPMGADTLQRVAREQERFAQVAGLCVAEPTAIDLLNSKLELHRLAVSLDIPVPRQDGEIPCPCVVKPICGEKFGLSAAQRYRICRDPQQREAAVNHFRALTGQEPLVQEYLPGAGGGVSVVAHRGKILAWIGHRRLREYPATGGPSSCCQAIEQPEVLEWAEKLAAATALSGPAMFEFKEDAAGKPRLLECNPRIWGSFPLTAAADSTLPYAWFCAAWNSGNEPALEIPGNAFRPGKRMIFFPSDTAAGLGYLKRRQPGKAVGAVLDLVNPAVADGLFSWRDPGPAMAYYRSMLRRGGKG